MNMKNKNERGSITLFVLVVMLFLMMAFVTSYTSIKNKQIEQEKQIKKIQNEYKVQDLESEYRKALTEAGII